MGKRCESYTDYKSLMCIFMKPDFSLRQQKKLELIKDYDLGINYHPRKVNVVADAWSRRSHMSQLEVESMLFELCEKFDKLNLKIVTNREVKEMEVNSTLLKVIRKGQVEDKKI
jgi:hypothetical protein